MRKIAVIVATVLPTLLHASDFYFPAGASSAGVGHASVASDGFWAVINNPAVTSFASEPEVGMGYESRFGLKELSVKSIGFYQPLKQGTLTGSFQHFGYSVYNELRFSAGYARKFGDKIAGSVQFTALSFHPDPETSYLYAFSVDAGMYARLSDRLNLGFYVFNIPASGFKSEAEISLPVRYRFGLQWALNDQTHILSEIRGENGVDPVVSAGVRYNLIENFTVSAGINNQPLTVSAGVFYTKWKFKPGLSASVVRQIGRVWNCSLSYAF